MFKESLEDLLLEVFGAIFWLTFQRISVELSESLTRGISGGIPVRFSEGIHGLYNIWRVFLK